MNNNNSPDGLRFQCLCLESTIECIYPQRCSQCGFVPCLAHRFGLSVAERLVRMKVKSRDVPNSELYKFLIQSMKMIWMAKKAKRDQKYRQLMELHHTECSRKPLAMPGWARDDLFRNGHGPECIEHMGKLLFTDLAKYGEAPENDSLYSSDGGDSQSMDDD